MRLRSIRLFPFVVGLLFSSLLGQVTYRLPHIANGANAIQTTFVLVNNSSNDATVTLSFFDDGGDPISINIPGLNEGPAKVVQLAAGESRLLSTDGQGELVTGSASVISVGAEIGVSAIFTILKDEGAAILTEAGIPVSEPMTSFTLAVNTIGEFNTGLAVANLGSGETTLTFNLYDEAGNLADTTTPDDPLPEGGHLAVFVDELFDGLGDFKGRLAVTSDGPVAALTLRQNAIKGTPLTTLPVVPISSSRKSFNLPHIANGGGIKTQFVIFSLGLGGTVNLSLNDDNGAGLEASLSNGETASSFQLELPANGAIFVETTGAGELAAGSARIESDVPVGLSSIFSLLDDEGNITVEAGVGDAPLRTSFTLPVDQSGGFRTGVALQNVSATEEANVEFTYYNESGNPVGNLRYQIAAPAPIPPLGHVALFVDEIGFEDVSGTKGQLAVTSDIPLAAIGLRQGAAAGTLTTLPVLPGAFDGGGGPVPGADNLLPRTVTGVTVTSNTIQNVQLDGGFELSGNVSLPGGYFPFSGIIILDGAGNAYQGSISVFPVAGPYSVVVPPGTHRALFCAISVSGPLPELSGTVLSQFETNVVVNGDTVRNFNIALPALAAVTGTVVGTEKLPPAVFPDDTFVLFVDANSNTQAITALEADGSFEVALSPGTYEASITFGETAGFEFVRSVLLYGLGTVNVGPGGASDVNLTVPDLVEVTGNVHQPDTQDYTNGNAYAWNLQFPDTLDVLRCVPTGSIGVSFAPTQGDGSFSLLVPSGVPQSYFASVPVSGNPTADQPGQITSPLIGSNPHAFVADANLDLPIPAYPAEVVLSGTVTGPNGAPVSGATVTAGTSGGLVGAADAVFSVSTTTDEQGNYSVNVLVGTNYTIEVRPPIDSGFPF